MIGNIPNDLFNTPAMHYGNYYNNEYPYPSWTERLKMFFKHNDALRNLLVINVGVSAALLILALIIRLVGVLSAHPMSLRLLVMPWISCPADIYVLLSRPWTLLTSIFVHAGFGHLFFNMLMLYVAGKFFLNQLGNRRLWATYLLGGITGNIIYIVGYNVLPAFAGVVSHASCIGASGAIMAVLFTVLIYQPNYRIRIFPFYRSNGIAMKWIALVFVVLDLAGMAKGTNAGGHIAHLGGALYGSVYALFLRGGVHFPKFSWPKRNKKKTKKFYTSSQSQRPMSDEDFNAKKRQDEKHVDEILDKIAKDGYGALTKEEKDFLYNYKR